MGKPITEKRLYNITLFYLSKYEASTGKVRQMLKRRIDKAAQIGAEIPSETTQWIEAVIQKMCALGYINDSRYAENQTRILARQGKSATFIVRKLQQAGIPIEITRSFLDASDESDTDRAYHWLKRHRKGGFRSKQPTDTEEKRSLFQKDLAALGRVGFAYVTAKEALTHSYENAKICDDFDTDLVSPDDF